MRHKQYQKKCEVCGSYFVAYRKGTYACSNKCRAKAHRDRKKDLIESNQRLVQTQRNILRSVIPDQSIQVEKVDVKRASSATGKDLTECKRPDGSHLYTDQDLWILIARINQLVFAEGSGSLLSQLDTNMRAEALIRDFEKRFDCKFDDVKRANPRIRPAGTDAENETLIIKYASLAYSR